VACGVGGLGAPVTVIKPPSQPSRMYRAALWLSIAGGTLQDAGDRFGCTREAVRQAWRRLFGDTRLPTRVIGDAVTQRITELVSDGYTTRGCSELLGMSPSAVRAWCIKKRISLPRKVVRWPDTPEADHAVREVNSRACIVDVALKYETSVHTLQKALAERGVAGSRSQRGRKDGRGRGARALARMDAGEPMTEACRAEQVAYSTVFKMRRRRDGIG
jgi:predicted transcriptional regulator